MERRIVERAYFLLRAEAELRHARRAACERSAKAHFQIAGAYFDKVHRLLPLKPVEPATVHGLLQAAKAPRSR